jgi:hypothetical protein
MAALRASGEVGATLAIINGIGGLFPPPCTVRLGTSSRVPEGVPLPPSERGLGPPENPLFTDPGGAGTSTEFTGLSPAITSEVSVAIDALAVNEGGGAVMVAVSVGAAARPVACPDGGTNFGC